VTIAVTQEQINDMDLLTRPPKTKGNTHAKCLRWDADQGTVEAEAIQPGTMRELLRERIESHIPSGHIEALRRIEEEERQTLLQFAADVEGGEE
jgi:hypothetical protein